MTDQKELPSWNRFDYLIVTSVILITSCAFVAKIVLGIPGNHPGRRVPAAILSYGAALVAAASWRMPQKSRLLALNHSRAGLFTATFLILGTWILLECE